MSAIDLFKGANTNFSERGERLTPLQSEETVEGPDGKKTTKFTYEGPAQYQVKVLRCTWKEARDKQEYFIADFEVLRSTNPKVNVGVQRNWMQCMTGKGSDAAIKRCGEFAVAAMGLEKTSDEVKAIGDKMDAILAAALLDPADPVCQNSLAGCILNVEVKQSISKDGVAYTAPTFSPAK